MGFFSNIELRKTYAVKNLTNPPPSCSKCKLHVGCKHPKTNWTGQGRLKILIVAEAMGRDEDNCGIQLVGQVGQFLRSKLKDRGYDLDRDFWKINAVNCFPKGEYGHTRPPTKMEIECCRPMVEEAIKELKPNFIWVLGGSAINSFYANVFSTHAITRWRGLCIPDRKYNAYILPQFHPSFAYRDETNKTLQSVYNLDLDFAISCLEKQPLEERDEPEPTILYEYRDVLDVLDDTLIAEPKYLAFDYEANCLKPQRPDSKLTSISFRYDDKTYSFPYQYKNHFQKSEQVQIKLRWRKILTNSKIKKIAQSLKFEDTWSRVSLGIEPKGWEWDTMLSSHILDCRRKYTSLNFQTYINFGVRPYDAHIKDFLKTKGNSIYNKIDQAPLDELLLYGGFDSHWTFDLYTEQKKVFAERKTLEKPRKFFLDGTLCFSDMQMNGIPANEEYYNTTNDDLKVRIKSLKEGLMTSNEAEEYKEAREETLNLDSSDDLGDLFYNVLKKTPNYTDKGNYTIDQNILRRMKTPFTNSLLEYNKLEKLRGTYLAQFMREIQEGFMFPFFDLHIPISFRSSSQGPNFQNIPVRDEESRKICRIGITPSPGHLLLESDYGSIEVAMAACVTQDPTLINYIIQPHTDMHRDSASEIWILPSDEVTKTVRFYAKNGWVFPEFYGSYYVNCAKDLWENVIEGELTTASDYPIREHMRERGIKNKNDFEEHCQDFEHKFWDEWFVVYKKWKHSIQKELQKKGYIENKFGFQFSGNLSFNEASNYPIQSTAFHCLLWTLIRLVKKAKEEKWLSKIIAQIHDSSLTDTHPSELKHVIQTINQIGTKDIVKENPWINVPLIIDHEVTPVDGNWCEKEDYEEN